MPGNDAEGVSDDLALVQQCLADDEAAWRSFDQSIRPFLSRVLIGRGATELEAEEIVALVIAKCVTAKRDAKPSLLQRYDGRVALRSWLAVVATSRLIDLKRRSKFVGELPGTAPKEETTAAPDPFDNLPDASQRKHDATLRELLYDVLSESMAQCTAEEFVLLRLYFYEQVQQKALANAWGRDVAGISRRLKKAVEGLRQRVEDGLKSHDPWLELDWEDILESCRCMDHMDWSLSRPSAQF